MKAWALNRSCIIIVRVDVIFRDPHLRLLVHLPASTYRLHSSFYEVRKALQVSKLSLQCLHTEVEALASAEYSSPFRRLPRAEVPEPFYLKIILEPLALSNFSRDL